jgi:hypothetical protein
MFSPSIDRVIDALVPIALHVSTRNLELILREVVELVLPRSLFVPCNQYSTGAVQLRLTAGTTG